MSRCNVLFLSDDFPPETNAAATRVYERAIYWKKWGIDTEIITNFPNKFLGKDHVGYSNSLYRVDDVDGIKVVRVKTYVAKKQSTLFRALDQMSYMITSFVAGIFMRKPDVIISTTPQFFCGLSGMALSKIRGVPFILEVADIWSDSIKGTGASSAKFYGAFRAIENYLYRKSNAIIVLTYSFREEILRRGIDDNKLFVIRNGIKKGLFSGAGKSNNIINKYNLKNRIVVGYIGSLGSAQGLSNVIDAAAIAHVDNNEDIVFMFVGEGIEKDELVRSSIGLNNVIFIPGQSINVIPDYLSSCDIGIVHLKDNDVFKKVIPSKILEMMAMGLPILLVSPDGEATKIVKEYNIGRWVCSGNPKLLIDTLLEMIADKDNMKVYSNNSLSAVEHFSREKQAHKVIDVVNAVTGVKI